MNFRVSFPTISYQLNGMGNLHSFNERKATIIRTNEQEREKEGRQKRDSHLTCTAQLTLDR